MIEDGRQQKRTEWRVERRVESGREVSINVAKPYEATGERNKMAEKGGMQIRRECRRMREEAKKEEEKVINMTRVEYRQEER